MIGTVAYAINDNISSCRHHHSHPCGLSSVLDQEMIEPPPPPSSLHHRNRMIVDDQPSSRSFPFGKSNPHPSSPTMSTKTLPVKKRRPSSSKCTVRPTKHVLALAVRSANDCGRRRVHFQQDPVSRRVVRRVVYGRVTMTEEEKKALWWDNELRKSSRHSIRTFMRDQHLDGLPKEEFEFKYRQAVAMCNSNCTDITDIPILSDTPIRGLEQKVFPDSINSRQDIVRKVVAAQQKLPKQLSPDQQSKLLRAASQNLTRSSRMLARLYGIGDATVVADDTEKVGLSDDHCRFGRADN